MPTDLTPLGAVVATLEKQTSSVIRQVDEAYHRHLVALAARVYSEGMDMSSSRLSEGVDQSKSAYYRACVAIEQARTSHRRLSHLHCCLNHHPRRSEPYAFGCRLNHLHCCLNHQLGWSEPTHKSTHGLAGIEGAISSGEEEASQRGSKQRAAGTR